MRTMKEATEAAARGDPVPEAPAEPPEEEEMDPAEGRAPAPALS